MINPKYRRSARTESRLITKKNATAILACWTLTPFRWKKNKFKCAYCEDTFSVCADLREHVRACSTDHTTKDIYKKYKEMPLINVDITDAKCSYCSSPFTNVGDMRQHVLDHGLEFDSNHPDGVLPFSLDMYSWKCILCNKIFNNFLKLYEHMNVHYQYYICATCGKGYMTAPRLRKHSEVHISGSFPCNECGKIFVMRAARDAHRASQHAKEPRYECPHCKMRFEGYYGRKAHMEEVHSEREISYKCSSCELSFKTSGQKAIHVKSVHLPLQANFKCSYCGWQFKTNYELKRHVVRHTGDKTFQCYVCNKCFSRERALTKHLETHDEEDYKWREALNKQKFTQMNNRLNVTDIVNE